MSGQDQQKGVWKSGKGKGRHVPKGRQLDDTALAEVRALLGDRPRRRDLLIEHLHLIQDRYGHLSACRRPRCMGWRRFMPISMWCARANPRRRR
jgi:hypothetical protein